MPCEGHHGPAPHVKNNYLTEMCIGSEAGSYSRLVDFVYLSTLGLRVIKKKKKAHRFGGEEEAERSAHQVPGVKSLGFGVRSVGFRA